MSKIEQLWYTRQVNKPWREEADPADTSSPTAITNLASLTKTELVDYARQLGLSGPWGHRGTMVSRIQRAEIRVGGDIKIHVRGDTLEKELQESAYFTSAIVDAAVQKIFNFYGRQVAIQATDITQEAHYFVPRPNTKSSLLISVPE